MSGGVAVVSMVRDEGDVIELFVRINARSAEHLYVIDHGSSDRTREILMRLQAEGLPCSLFEHVGTFQQAAALTHLIRQIASAGHAFIIPLDADEFLPLEHTALRELLAHELRSGHCGWLPWRNYGPASLDWDKATAPLFEVMRPSRSEQEARYKVVIPGALAARAILSEGSHLMRVAGDSEWHSGILLSQPLLHAPVRSAAQISAKALLGSMTLALKPNRQLNEGGHWDTLAAMVAASGYRLDLEQLQSMIKPYTGHAPDQTVELDSTASGIGRAEDTRRWPELARFSLEARLHQFAQGLCRRLSQAPA